MTDRLAIALAQLNPTVGAIDANLVLAREAYARAKADGADLVLLSELFITGYPPEDLVLKPSFLARARAAVEALAADTAGDAPAIVIGTPWAEEGKVYNAVALLAEGKVEAVRFKHDLPNYGPFDEKRVFATGPMPEPVLFRGVKLGLPICEDIWTAPIARHLAKGGAEIMLVANGSPYHFAKFEERLAHVGARAGEAGVPFAYVNQLGGQDELVFDGGSFVVNADGARPVMLPSWQAAVVTTEWQRGKDGWHCANGPQATAEEGMAAIYQAAMWGLRDYVEKNGFPGVLLGLSGGIDSALTAAIAADALGPERVRCVMLPYRFTSSISLEDAEACAKALGCRYEVIPIARTVEAAMATLTAQFANRPFDVTEENLQSRTRGLLLMALSNKFGEMLLTTGNKSEVSVGYATLYGDMCGGYNPLKDLYKTQVFRLARWRNENHPKGAKAPAGEVIPERVITRPPTAELREDQKDEDSLPPYDQLDAILEGLVEEDLSVDEIAARGFAPEVVRKVEHLLYISEYKRRQAAPGVKISRRNFGRDRRYPITNAYRDRQGEA
jgi:NAD+ synthase